MINMVILPLKTVVWVTLGEEAQIFHQHFQMYLKIFLEILWEAVREESLVRLLKEDRISDTT